MAEDKPEPEESLEPKLSRAWVPGVTTGRMSVDEKLDMLLRQRPPKGEEEGT